MSTRSYVGNAATGRVVYVHFDGYPEARLPILSRLIERDGAEEVVKTLMSARTGGWSFLGDDYDHLDNQLGERGIPVSGYGLSYGDGAQREPVYIGDGLSENDQIWIEYVYLIHPETGIITWFQPTDKTPVFHGVDPVEFLKDPENFLNKVL